MVYGHGCSYRSTIGLAISVTLYIQHLQVGWIPTFVAFVSIPASVVLLYGGGWKNTLTGSILGGILGFPIALFVIKVLLSLSIYQMLLGV